jgi:hypothetical protein
MEVTHLYDKPLAPATRITIILVIAVAGLFYVKWVPWRAAFDYAVAYGSMMCTCCAAPVVIGLRCVHWG